MERHDEAIAQLHAWIARLDLRPVERVIMNVLVEETEPLIRRSTVPSVHCHRSWMDSASLEARFGLRVGLLRDELWELSNAGYIEQPLETLPRDQLVLELLPVTG